MFMLISGGHIGPYKALQDAWNVSPNNSEIMGNKDMRLGKIVHILVFYNI